MPRSCPKQKHAVEYETQILLNSPASTVLNALGAATFCDVSFDMVVAGDFENIVSPTLWGMHRIGNPERGVGLGLLRGTLFVKAKRREITIIKHISITDWSTRNSLYALPLVFFAFHAW
jgi:hypothetical protein